MPLPRPSTPPERSTGRRWTAHEVRQLIADSPLASPRYELVEGELLVTPSPNGPHQAAVAALCAALHGYLRDNPVGRVRPSPFDVELESGTVLQPDVFVLPLAEARRVVAETPARQLLLATEILSPSSRRYDRVTKRPVYQRHGAEYWIVDTDARLFERWRPGDERPEILIETLEWQPAGAAAAFSLDLTRYFADVFEEA